MKDDPEMIRTQLRGLISEARETGLWLHCGYQDMWFTPDELEAANADDRFLWGPVNWQMRNPSVRTKQLIASVDAARSRLDQHMEKLS